MSKREQTYRIMISGGGTGGHIYPAISIAQALKATLMHVEILFVGAKGKMEMKKVPEAGFKIKGLWISGVQRKAPVDNLLLPVKLCSSLLGASRLIREFRPDAVVGVGGYASGPLLYVAGRKGIATLILEQNLHAGLTNKWLSKTAKTICVAYEGMEKYFPKEKIVVTGNPVRFTIKLHPKRIEEAWKHFELNSKKRTLLVMGGSLGAQSINESILTGLDKFRAADIQVIWQVGSLYYDEMLKRAGEIEKNIVIKDFIRQMDFAYAIADIVVSRAGALSIAELTITGKPSILVPSPNVAEDHQTTNAKKLKDNEAAIMIKDAKIADLLVDEAIRLINDEDRRTKLARNIRSMAHEHAAENIATEVIKLIA